MDDAIYPVPADFGGAIDADARSAMYARSLDDPDGFWLEQARRADRAAQDHGG